MSTSCSGGEDFSPQQYCSRHVSRTADLRMEISFYGAQSEISIALREITQAHAQGSPYMING